MEIQKQFISIPFSKITIEICKDFVDKGLHLKFIPPEYITLSICESSIKHDISCIEFIPERMIKSKFILTSLWKMVIEIIEKDELKIQTIIEILKKIGIPTFQDPKLSERLITLIKKKFPDFQIRCLGDLYYLRMKLLLEESVRHIIYLDDTTCPYSIQLYLYALDKDYEFSHKFISSKSKLGCTAIFIDKIKRCMIFDKLPMDIWIYIHDLFIWSDA